jgi:hypothetical protein
MVQPQRFKPVAQKLLLMLRAQPVGQQAAEQWTSSSGRQKLKKL